VSGASLLTRTLGLCCIIIMQIRLMDLQMRTISSGGTRLLGLLDGPLSRRMKINATGLRLGMEVGKLCIYVNWELYISRRIFHIEAPNVGGFADNIRIAKMTRGNDFLCP
jgi:hypothetical protein